MVALLARMRRERNGAVADAMRYYGTSYGLNYGVSLPTVRQIARSGDRDHTFARLLWMQEVRELKLAALHIAEPERLTLAEASQWAAGLVNSELAEEAAFALLCRAPHFPAIFAAWTKAETPFLAYAALLGGARSPQLTVQWLPPTLEIVHRATGKTARLVAQGTVALLEALGRQNGTSRQAVLSAVGPFESSGNPKERFVREELLWRLSETDFPQ